MKSAFSNLKSFNEFSKKAGKHDTFTKPTPMLHAVETFKKGFTFPQIALNDFAQE
jgi:hypothetical protein